MITRTPNILNVNKVWLKIVDAELNFGREKFLQQARGARGFHVVYDGLNLASLIYRSARI